MSMWDGFRSALGSSSTQNPPPNGAGNQQQQNDGNNQNNQNGGGNNQQTNGGNNNNKNNNDAPLGIWDDPVVKQGDNNQQQQNNNQQQQAGGEKKPSFQEFVNGLKFDIQTPPEVAEKLARGDLTVLPQMLESASRAAYAMAMQHAGQLLDSRVQSAVQDAVGKADGNRNAANLVTYMESKLPFTADPDLAPVAQSVMARALKAGKSRDEAVQTVERFFKRTSTLATKTLGGQNSGDGPLGGRRFSNQANQDDGEDTDWMTLLGAPQNQ